MFNFALVNKWVIKTCSGVVCAGFIVIENEVLLAEVPILYLINIYCEILCVHRANHQAELSLAEHGIGELSQLMPVGV